MNVYQSNPVLQIPK